MGNVSNKISRRYSRKVRIGGVSIGGGEPIAIQSMCSTDTRNIEATVKQIERLKEAGCRIIRCAVPDMEAAEAISVIKKKTDIPLVADIHFDYRLAIAAMERGADKIRINPGNIGSAQKLRAVVEVARERQIPIRVGVNGGSLEQGLREKYGGVCAEALVESAADKLRMVEDMGYDNLVVSIKSSDVMMCVEAYERISTLTEHPLHVGITEAGLPGSGTVKSAVGLALILSRGIGDTIRVSLTGDPEEEIYCAQTILRTLGLGSGGVEVISCPTCGRTQIDLTELAAKVESMVRGVCADMKVAVMGCVVNGPGEAREADLAICAGRGAGLILKKGEIIKKVPEEQLPDAFYAEFKKMVGEDTAGDAGSGTPKDTIDR